MDDFKHVPNHAQPEMLHIRLARRAGVRRGINASIQALEELAKTASDADTLVLIKAMRHLQTLSIEEVEG